MATQFTTALSGDDSIALPGMRVKSMAEEVLSLPLMVDPAYPVKSGSPIYLTADKKGCTTTQNANAGYVGAVVFANIGKTGAGETYVKGDVVPVLVKGKLWVPVKTAVTNVATAVTGADATGNFSQADTPLKGVRFHNPSVGSKNLTITEFLGV